MTYTNRTPNSTTLVVTGTKSASIIHQTPGEIKLIKVTRN